MQPLRNRIIVAGIGLLLSLYGCSNLPDRPSAQGSPAGSDPARLAVVASARHMLGKPYRFGGSSPRGFDCSGLVQYSYAKAGLKLPRTSQQIFRASQLINPDNLQAGDLVFFTISSKKIAHVGIYADGNRFIHAPSSGKSVSYASLKNPYWKRRLVAAGRF